MASPASLDYTVKSCLNIPPPPTLNTYTTTKAKKYKLDSILITCREGDMAFENLQGLTPRLSLFDESKGLLLYSGNTFAT